MKADEAISLLCVQSDLTLSQMAGKLDKTSQAFSQKMKRESFTLDDLQKIAMVTGRKLECSLILPNGEKVGIQ